ncbi:hypothetical protein ACLKA6_005853 [Drosophila palustris]
MNGMVGTSFLSLCIIWDVPGSVLVAPIYCQIAALIHVMDALQVDVLILRRSSCYLPPRVPIQEFKAALDDVVGDAQGKSPILIAGDFNAWCTDWGSKRNNQRGLILADAFAHLNVCLLNNGSQSTFSMAGRESIIDLTFASPALARDAAWQVSDIYTNSDHNAIITDLRTRITTRRTQPARHVGYKVNTLNRTLLLSNVQTISATGDANSCAQKIADCIRMACDASMAKLYSGGSWRKPVPWWNDEIAKARSDCCAAKRKLQRSRGRPSFESNLVEFRIKRRKLRSKIIESKTRCFQELCDAADAEPFGSAYRMVMGKLHKQPMPTCAVQLEAIVSHLFPQQPPLSCLVHLPDAADDVVQATASEVLEIAAKIKPGKAPGPDGIPNAVLKTIIAAHTWQARWQSSVNGSWTRRLISDIRPWIKRRHGQVDFYICQLLTGHGCFRAYLHRFKHAESPYCDHCLGEVVDDAEHAFFECPLFDPLRRRMRADGHQLTADNIVDHMLKNEENWNAVGWMAATIMRELRRRERSRAAD